MTHRIRPIFALLLVLAAALLLALAYSYFIEPRRLVVNQQTLTIKSWDAALDGFKIVAVGDVHGGSNAVDEAKIRRIVELANEQNADLIVLLGDYVAQGRGTPLGDRNVMMPMHTIAENLAGLKAKYGVIAIMGNHDDWYSNGEVTTELHAIGYTVLDDEILKLDVNGHELRILGLRDQLHIGNWKTYSDNLKRIIAQNIGSG